MEPDESMASRILALHGYEPRSIVRITDGYSHHMYECDVGERLILRIARPDRDERSNIAKELWAMEEFRKQGIPVPELLGSNTGDAFPFHYIIMRKLRGTPLNELLPHMERGRSLRVMRNIGAMMARMHRPFADFGELCEGGRIFRKKEFSFRKIRNAPERNAWVAHQLTDAGENIGELLAHGMITAEQAMLILSYLYGNIALIEDAKPVMCHVDLIPNHIFIEGDAVVGVIDFEFAAAYPREFEFVKFSRLGILDDKEVKDALLDGYGREMLSERFDAALAYYRVTRDLGFCRHVTQSGDVEACARALANVLALIGQ